jgi:hypothetical protein
MWLLFQIRDIPSNGNDNTKTTTTHMTKILAIMTCAGPEVALTTQKVMDAAMASVPVQNFMIS